MGFVLLELGCIECGESKGTAVLGSFPTLETGMAGLNNQLDKYQTPNGWTLKIEQRPEVIEEYDYWSPSLVAEFGGSSWRVQLHKVDG